MSAETTADEELFKRYFGNKIPSSNSKPINTHLVNDKSCDKKLVKLVAK